MVLGCAKGTEIDLQEVVILPILPPSAADASVDSGAETPATTNEETPPPAEVGPGENTLDAGETPDVEALDAAAPALGDSGT